MRRKSGREVSNKLGGIQEDAYLDSPAPPLPFELEPVRPESE